MPETKFSIAPVRRPAVAASTIAFRTVKLEAMGPSTIVQVLAAAGEGEAGQTDTSGVVRRAGPGQWFLVRDGESTPQEIGALARRFEPGAVLVDQSHGRARFRCSGPRVRDMLAKLVPIDLSPDEFPIGAATMTLAGHVGIHLTRTSDDVFEILPLRGFAGDLWGGFLRASEEFS